ncbi:MAG: MFS transporter [Bacteroidetes bacterium]|nr:MFS transporter [Bacteroidota bacterium]
MNRRSEAHLVLVALWLLMFSSSSQFFIMAPILPEIGEQLMIPQNILGTLITAYAFSLGFFALVVGPISDKIGRRKILLWGSGAMALSLALHGLAHDYITMLMVRSLTGISGGILTGSCVAYIGDYFPAKRRGWANGMVATGSAIGQVVGIPIGTIMVEHFGVASPFYMFSFTMAIAFGLVVVWVPQPSVQLYRGRITVKRTLGKYLEMLRDRHMRNAALGYLLMFLSITIYVVYFPTWLENAFSASAYEIALLFLIGGLATVFAGPAAGRLADVRGRKAVILLSSAGLVLLMSLTTFLMGRDIFNAYILFFTVMLLITARMIPFQALASEIIPDHSRGKLMCLTIAIGQLGMGIGAGLAGFSYSSFGFLGNSLIGAMAALLMGLIVWKFLPETNNILTRKNELSSIS